MDMWSTTWFPYGGNLIQGSFNPHFLGWPLKPFEKYKYIGSLIKPIGENIKDPGAYPVFHVNIPSVQAISHVYFLVDLLLWYGRSITSEKGVRCGNPEA